MGRINRAFSMPELLVTLLVIVVVVSIAIPSISAIRRRADEAACQAVLKGISGAASLIVADQAGYMPGRVPERGDSSAHLTIGETEYSVSLIDQTLYWPGAFIGTLWEPGTSASVWTCPSLLRRHPLSAQWRRDVVPNPQVGGMLSYLYSAAMLTAPSVWVAPGPITDQVLFAAQRRVRLDEITYPSGKVLFAEAQSFHGQLAPLYAPGSERFNALFVDGHVESVLPQAASKPLPAACRYTAWEDRSGSTVVRSVPFSSAAGGARSRDY